MVFYKRIDKYSDACFPISYNMSRNCLVVGNTLLSWHQEPPDLPGDELLDEKNWLVFEYFLDCFFQIRSASYFFYTIPKGLWIWLYDNWVFNLDGIFSPLFQVLTYWSFWVEVAGISVSYRVSFEQEKISSVPFVFYKFDTSMRIEIKIIVPEKGPISSLKFDKSCTSIVVKRDIPSVFIGYLFDDREYGSPLFLRVHDTL